MRPQDGCLDGNQICAWGVVPGPELRTLIASLCRDELIADFFNAVIEEVWISLRS